MGADCKSVGESLRRFESYTCHRKPPSITNDRRGFLFSVARGQFTKGRKLSLSKCGRIGRIQGRDELVLLVAEMGFQFTCEPIEFGAQTAGIGTVEQLL